MRMLTWLAVLLAALAAPLAIVSLDHDFTETWSGAMMIGGAILVAQIARRRRRLGPTSTN